MWDSLDDVCVAVDDRNHHHRLIKFVFLLWSFGDSKCRRRDSRMMENLSLKETLLTISEGDFEGDFIFIYFLAL